MDASPPTPSPTCRVQEPNEATRTSARAGGASRLFCAVLVTPRGAWLSVSGNGARLQLPGGASPRSLPATAGTALALLRDIEGTASGGQQSPGGAEPCVWGRCDVWGVTCACRMCGGCVCVCTCVGCVSVWFAACACGGVRTVCGWFRGCVRHSVGSREPVLGKHRASGLWGKP